MSEIITKDGEVVTLPRKDYLDFGGGFMTSLEIDKLTEALAKAQKELKNPAKTKEAKIESQKQNGSSASYAYKYVDFAVGLEEVRRALSENGISFIQMPHVVGGDLNVLTRLMCGNQWMQGLYPVSEIAEHRKMGGALTYAKRYALFSIVGVAGEDDLDAEPEVTAQPQVRKAADKPVARSLPKPQPEVQLLSATDSKSTAKAMIDDLQTKSDRKALLDWVQSNKPLKDMLQPDDAKTVQDAFVAAQRQIQAKSNGNGHAAEAETAH